MSDWLYCISIGFGVALMLNADPLSKLIVGLFQ